MPSSIKQEKGSSRVHSRTGDGRSVGSNKEQQKAVKGGERSVARRSFGAGSKRRAGIEEVPRQAKGGARGGPELPRERKRPRPEGSLFELRGRLEPGLALDIRGKEKSAAFVEGSAGKGVSRDRTGRANLGPDEDAVDVVAFKAGAG